MKYTYQLILEELNYFCNILANFINDDLIIGLIGELGSGKTTFVRHFVKQLGILDTVSSPSYTIENIYTSPDSKILIKHIDLYRGVPEQELKLILEKGKSKDILEIFLIEWLNLTDFDLKEPYLLLNFNIPEIGHESARNLEISGNVSFFKDFMDKLAKKSQ